MKIYGHYFIPQDFLGEEKDEDLSRSFFNQE